MQALILAAGQGARLLGSHSGPPKCLVTFDGLTLLEYQVRVLRFCGVGDICVVVGYGFEQVLPYLEQMGCTWRLNEDYANTNSLYSLSLAIDWLQEDFLMCNSDVLADPQIFKLLVSDVDDILAYDSGSGAEAEHMKVRFGPDGSLKRIGKELAPSDCSGENLGVLNFKQRTIPLLKQAVDSALKSGGKNQWAPAAIDQLAQSTRIVGLDVQGLPWVEIDFPDDLTYAQSTIWPQIVGGFDGFSTSASSEISSL